MQLHELSLSLLSRSGAPEKSQITSFTYISPPPPQWPWSRWPQEWLGGCEPTLFIGGERYRKVTGLVDKSLIHPLRMCLLLSPLPFLFSCPPAFSTSIPHDMAHQLPGRQDGTCIGSWAWTGPRASTSSHQAPANNFLPVCLSSGSAQRN